MEPLRILMVCPDYKPNPGGEAEVAYCLAVALQQLGHTMTVLAPRVDERVPEDDSLFGAVRRELALDRFRSMKSWRGWLTWPIAMGALFAAVRRAARKSEPDICIVTSYMTWVMISLWWLRIPYVLYLHGEDVRWMIGRGGVSRTLFRRACSSAKLLFFNSGHSRNALVRVIPSAAERSSVVGCGVRADVRWTTDRRAAARTALGWPEGPVVLTVARLVAKKGIDTVIRALPAVLERHPNCRYVVIGDGPDRCAIAELAVELGLAKQVVFLGHVDEETKQQCYAASDLFLMVSRPGVEGEEEGFGIVFLEANQHGLPVIGSRCGGIPESVEHEVNGLIVEPDRPADVAQAVDRLLSHPELCGELVQRGQERIEQTFNWTAIGVRIGLDLHKVTTSDTISERGSTH